MKILYALQGTGNGHIGRAREITPLLVRYGEVHLAVSGNSSEIPLPVPPRYRLHGLSFAWGRDGGIDYRATLAELRLPRLVSDICSFPIEQYDFVINDFEPVTAWAAKRAGVPCIAMSHQAAFLSPMTPRWGGRTTVFETFMNRYAPSDDAIGFHFEGYDSFIRPPVVRREVRSLEPRVGEHYTVYLPAYDDEALLEFFSHFPQVSWEIFSKHGRASYQTRRLSITPIENSAYLKSLAGCRGLIAGAGFEAPSEALYLKKKLLLIPQRGQHEQWCNVAAALRFGVAMLPGLQIDYLEEVARWLESNRVPHLEIPDHTERTVEEVVELGSKLSRERERASGRRAA